MYCPKDDQHSRVLWVVNECGIYSGQPIRKLHPLQSGRNPRIDTGDQDSKQLWPERVTMCHAVAVQQSVFFYRIYSKP